MTPSATQQPASQPVTTRRTLPVAIHPRPDETWHAWTVRLANALGIEHVTALHAAGYLDTPDRLDSGATGYGLILTEQAISTLQHTTRASADQLRGTLLTLYDGGPFSSAGINLTHRSGTRKLGAREWLLLGNSRACPACLTDNDHTWWLPWRLPWTTICTTHRALMATNCPNCGSLFNGGQRPDSSVGPALTRQPVSTTHCSTLIPNPHSGAGQPAKASCGHAYADVPISDCHSEPLLAAQNYVNALLTPSERNRHRQWWLDLRTITGTLLTHGNTDLYTDLIPDLPSESCGELVRHYTERDKTDRHRAKKLAKGRDHRTLKRVRNSTKVTQSAALLAPVMGVAIAVLHDLNTTPDADLDQPEIVPAGIAYEAFAQALKDRGHAPRAPLTQRHASPRLLEAVEKTRNYAGRTRQLKPLNGATPNVNPRHIPRLWRLDHYQAVADLFEQRHTTPEFARQYLSLAAARIVTGGNWRDAAHALNWDPDKASPCSTVIPDRLQPDELSSIHEHVHTVLHTLARTPATELVNYRALEGKYARQTHISRARWNRLCRQAGVTLQATDARLRNYAAWEWQTVALMPLKEWPGWNAHPNRASALELFYRFRKRDIPQLHP